MTESLTWKRKACQWPEAAMSKLATTPIPLMPQHPDRDDLALSNDRDALCVCVCVLHFF